MNSENKLLEPKTQATKKYIAKALEKQFPMLEISRLAEYESWRKEINRPLYHFHKWWATRLGSTFRAIILGAISDENINIWTEFYNTHHLKNKIVLDPFMGSGTTIGEALKLGCKTIGCDINPISTFLVRQALTRIDEKLLQETFFSIEKKIASEIRCWYKTIDPETGKSIPVLYYFWVKCVTTPSGEIIPLFSNYVFSKDAYPSKKPLAQIVCPNCWKIITERYDINLLNCQYCNTCFNPQKGPVAGQYVTDKDGKKYRIKDLMPKNGAPLDCKLYALLALRDNCTKIYLPATDEDKELYRQAEVELQLNLKNLPLPSMEVRSGHNTEQARSYNYKYWRNFFNARQLLCLGKLLKEILTIKDEMVREQFLCLFSNTLEFNNIFCSFKGEGTGAVRPIFSNHILKPERTPLENNIWGVKKGSGTFSSLFESRFIKAKNYLNNPFEIKLEPHAVTKALRLTKFTASKPIGITITEAWENFKNKEESALIINGDSGSLPLPNECVDAVVTDPPYFDFIHYSELSDFFFAWLAPVLKHKYYYFNQEDSSSKNEVQHKDAIVFSNQLLRVFTECNRVLKKDGVLTFSFHHSRPGGWLSIYSAVKNAGFYFVNTYPVHAELRAASVKASTKEPISLDAILVCKKEKKCLNNYKIKNLKFSIAYNADLLISSGMKLSSTDYFVIGASQLLLKGSLLDLSEHQLLTELNQLYEICKKGNLKF